MVALVAVILGLTVAKLNIKPDIESADRPSDYSLADFQPGPDSILNLVNRADAIVIGKVGSETRVVEEGAPNESDRFPPSYPPPPRFVFTAYQILIEEVILDDGIIQLQSPPTLMVQGRPEREFDFGQYMRMPHPGHRYLLALARNFDNSYSVYRAGGLYSVDGPVVTRWDKDTAPITFTDKVTTADFIQAVRNAISFKRPFSPSDIHWRVIDSSAPPSYPPDP
jgi:hypothetical protein